MLCKMGISFPLLGLVLLDDETIIGIEKLTVDFLSNSVWCPIARKETVPSLMLLVGNSNYISRNSYPSKSFGLAVMAASILPPHKPSLTNRVSAVM